MNKPNFTNMFRGVKVFATKHSPEILTSIGVAGMLTTVILAVKATPKALELIQETKKEKRKEKLTPVETVQATWKCYIPAAATGIASTACIVGASSVSLKRNAALATAYKLSETAFAEYKEQVVETIGEKKEQIVREKVAEKKLEKNPVNESAVILTGKGNTLCMEPITGQYFRSDMEQIKKTVNDLNEKLLRDPFGYMSLNDFLVELCPSLETSIKGDEIGWNVINGIIRVDFHAKMAKNDEPCIVIDYTNAPQYDFYKYS